MFNIDRNLYVILLLIFYIPAIYRMAIMITIDTGPLEIFENLRTFFITKNVIYNEIIQQDDSKNNWLYYWRWRLVFNLDEGINCTDCTGVWSAMILGVILSISLYYDYVGIIIFIMGGAGFQHYITNQNNDTE